MTQLDEIRYIAHIAALNGKVESMVESTELEGVIDLISVRGKPAFSLNEWGTRNRVRCAFPDGLFETAKASLRHPVTVAGMVRYRRDGTPTSIFDVTSITPLRPGESMRPLRGALPDLTSEYTAEEYVHRMREDIAEPN